MSFLDKFKFKKKPFKEGEENIEDAKEEKKVVKPSEDVKVEKKTTDTKKEVKKEKKTKTKTAKKKEVKPASSVKSKKGNTGNAYKILIKPVISEKVTDLGEINQYVFDVSLNANKSEVKKAIQNVYGVTPIKVRIIRILGKRVRFGRTFGKLKDRKKAIVTLKKGETIQIYEGV